MNDKVSLDKLKSMLTDSEATYLSKLFDASVSTQLRKLDKDNYERFIIPDRLFWTFISKDEKHLLNLPCCQYVKIKVTYVRSHCFFYTFVDYPEAPEQFCATRSFYASELYPVVFDPAEWGFPSDWTYDTLDGRVTINNGNNNPL